MSGKKFSLKVILVGNSGVGKTSLVSAFFENPFETQSLPTIAPASCSAIIPLDNNVSVELQIWDTAGQERFQSISHMFYRDSCIAFVCFDKESVDSVEIWIGRVRAEVPECAIFLVTTKSDLLVDTERTELEEKGAEMIKGLVQSFTLLRHQVKEPELKSYSDQLLNLSIKSMFLTNQQLRLI